MLAKTLSLWCLRFRNWSYATSDRERTTYTEGKKLWLQPYLTSRSCIWVSRLILYTRMCWSSPADITRPLLQSTAILVIDFTCTNMRLVILFKVGLITRIYRVREWYIILNKHCKLQIVQRVQTFLFYFLLLLGCDFLIAMFWRSDRTEWKWELALDEIFFVWSIEWHCIIGILWTALLAEI